MYNSFTNNKEKNMAKFLLLHKGGTQPQTDEQKAAVLAEWNTWMAAVGEHMVDAGNPTSNVKTVSAAGIADFVGDRIGGYNIVEAESLDQAAEWAKTNPTVTLNGGSVDVYETFNIM